MVVFLAALLTLSGSGIAGLAEAGPVSGVSGVGAPAHFVVAIAVEPNTTYSTATVVLRAWVTGNATPQANVTVSFSSSGGGSFSPATGITGVLGEVNTSFTAPPVGSAQRLVLTASASSTGSGFLPGSGAGNLTVLPSGPFLVVTPSFPQGTSVHSGASDLIVARVTDSKGAPVSGANVTLGSTRGTASPTVGVSGPSGNVTFTLRAPSVTVATRAVLLFVANASGYANASTIASVTVNTGVAASLYVTINPATGNLSAGGSVRVMVTVRSTNTTGVLIAGANVSLILSDGTYSPTLVITGSAGTANFTFVAPPTLTKPATVTVTASATATNYAAGSATATYAVAAAAPTPAGGLSTSWLWILIAILIVAVIVAVIVAARRRRRVPPPATPPQPSPPSDPWTSGSPPSPP
jgi:adhesin/invasin